MLQEVSYNPDVLNCIANLSNDEVFTPPELANQVLDLLPSELWSNPDAKFLDPVCKSGVFLREIAKRLMYGLETRIPDLQKRIDHIFGKQLYGIAITELTALLARRSVYCSKNAKGKYSVCESFNKEQGNILFERMNHTWSSGRCTYCGASREVYDQGETLETHAYSFIHTDKPEKLFKMKFDVIIGNPPYQLNDGGGSNGISAKPIYHLFIEQAKKLSPRYLTMIIPSRWYAGGKGLNDFRSEMLSDKRIRTLVDFPKSRDCFPGVDIAGGVCYFLWDREYSGDCEIISKTGDDSNSRVRALNEFDIFIRDNIGIDIVHKVLKFKEPLYSSRVFTRNSFGFTTSDRGVEKPFTDSIKLISSSGVSYVSKDSVSRNKEFLSKYKICIGTLNPDRGGVNNAKDGKMNVTTKIKILFPNEVVTETYIVIDCLDSITEAENCASYFRTQFARFFLSLTLSSMHIVRENFQFVPIQNFSESWSDDKLHAKYGLTGDEISYIASLIRQMDFSQSSEEDE